MSVLGASDEEPVLGASLYGDERRAYVDQLVKTDLDASKGYVRPGELKEAQDQAWAELEPIINEIPGRPLSVAAVKELVAGVARGSVTEERRGQLIDLITSARTRVFETKASKTAELAVMNAEIAKERP